MGRVYKLGTIAGQHDMPVEDYISNWTNYGDNALSRITKGTTVVEIPPDVTTIELYYTGYTIATIAALLTLVLRGYHVILMEHSNSTGRYSPVHVMNHPLFERLKDVLDTEIQSDISL